MFRMLWKLKELKELKELKTNVLQIASTSRLQTSLRIELVLMVSS